VTSPHQATTHDGARTGLQGTTLRVQALVALSLLLGSLALQFRFPALIGSDGFFHIRLASGAVDGMPWLPHSVFAAAWVDHQFLFHLLLAPFTWFLADLVAAKVAAATFAALAAFACYRLLLAERAPAALLYTLLPAAVSWHFWLRMEMPRAQALSLALLVTALGALSRGQHVRLFILSWLYAWLYHVSLVLLPLAVAHTLGVALLAPGGQRRRIPWQGPLVVCGGLLAGLAIHPHSPRTFSFMYQHVVLKVLNRDALPVGMEWQDGSLSALLHSGWGGLVALVLGLALWAASRERRSGVTALFLLAASGATAASLLGTRFLEYAVPLSILALALALRDFDPSPPRFGWRPLRWAAAIGLGAMLLLSGQRLVTSVQETEPDPQRLAAAMTWAAEHIPAGETLFHFSWNDFPELVFHGPRYRYIAGLDPHFLALHDPELWDLYKKIGEGWGSNPSRAIREHFGARWAILVLPYEGGEDLLSADSGLSEIYRDGDAIIYRVAAGPGGDAAEPGAERQTAP
jgi:hypothetical protein